MIKSQIPYDTQWNDIDYMQGVKDFTFNKESFADLPQFVKEELHDKYNMHYINIVDPAIANHTEDYPPFTSGVSQDIFVKNEDGGILWGMVWPNVTAYPDFGNPATHEW